jgi:hypothetical protein
MNRTEYRKARALVRPNGTAAYKWMPAEHAAVFRALAEQENDTLRMRPRLEPQNVKLRLALWPITSAMFEPAIIGRVKARAMPPVRVAEHRAEWDAFHAGEWLAD